MKTVALYARVSSEKQAQTDTIASQIKALENRITKDNYKIIENFKFIDNGYSGSNLERPALEKLRDKVANGEIDKVYIHSPDRLSRKYAYQMILLEELQKGGAEVIFLNYETNESPESHLLLQMQGMIAEYERAKAMERYRRGKIHAAQKGTINVLSKASYGYRYIDKYKGGGQAIYEVHADEAQVVQKIFFWIGHERLTIGAVCRRLKEMEISSPKGKSYWDKSMLWGLLKNPVYKGQAAFGKTKIGAMLPRLRPYKRANEHHKQSSSIYRMPKENWIYISVPAIIDKELFDVVQAQLEENKKVARTKIRGASYLLQGLLMCQCCHYSYYGKPVRNKRGDKIDRYAYYRCIGADAYRFGGEKHCNNKQIRTDTLETVVWEEVKFLLKNPNRILSEYKNRIAELKTFPLEQAKKSLESQENKLKRGITRLIDSYAEEQIEKNEFEPRIKYMKERLKKIEQQQIEILNKQNIEKELILITTNLKNFSSEVELKLESIDWNTKREIIRSLIRKIEIEQESINIVFRIQELPGDSYIPQKENGQNLQHCRGRHFSTFCKYLPARTGHVC